MTFKRFIETGRIARCATGKYKGRLICIVNVIDQNRVLIDGPLSGVPRQQYPVNHLHLTKFRVKFPFHAPTRVVRKSLEAFNIKEKWTGTKWAENAKAKAKRRFLTDFERFAVRVAHSSRNRIVSPVFKRLKSEGNKVGIFSGKTVKGTKPYPKIHPEKETKKVVKRVKKVKKPKKTAKKVPAKK